MKNVLVKNCNNCPFLSFHEEACDEEGNEHSLHCQADEKERNIYRVEDIDSHKYNEIINPIWCPLIDIDSIYVVLKK